MTGLVTLLGAGPGDVELLTIKGARRLKEADVLVYDRLVNRALFDMVGADCELIDVGKQPGMPCVRQDEIERILIDKASQGKRVVRLKSGDPYIFGRGGEEAQALVKAGLSFEVVPGVTSAIAGLTYAGIPMTYRDVATSFHVFTGHLQDETEQLNWEAIAQLKGTLVFLMGMKNLATITKELTSRGYAAETPVAIVEWATHPQQRSIDGTLANIVELVAEHGLKAPSLIVIGDVVAFRKELNFHEQLPLSQKRILIQESPTGKLPRLLKDAGADLLKFPMRSRVTSLDMTLPDLDKLDGLVIADMQSWEFFIQSLKQAGLDLRQLAHVKFAAVGQHTAHNLEKSGILLTYKAAQVTDQAFIDALKAENGAWYVVAPNHKTADLEAILGLPVLESHAVDFDGDLDSGQWHDLDAICLPNSLAAANFVALLEQTGLNSQAPIIVMGASTRDVLERAGLTNIVETDELTIMAIVDKCRQQLT